MQNRKINGSPLWLENLSPSQKCTQREACKNTSLEPRLSPEQVRASVGAQGGSTGQPHGPASGLLLLLLYKYRNLKSGTAASAEQALLPAQRGRSGELNSFTHTWLPRGGISESSIISKHMHSVHMLQTKNRNTQDGTWSKFWERLFQSRNLPVVSAIYSKNPSAKWQM